MKNKKTLKKNFGRSEITKEHKFSYLKFISEKPYFRSNLENLVGVVGVICELMIGDSMEFPFCIFSCFA